MVHSNPQPESGTQLERPTYELLDAHDDSARLLAGLPPDARREAQLRYLRDLQRLGREALARGDPSQRANAHAPTPENPGLAQSDAYAFRYKHCDIPPGLSIRELGAAVGVGAGPTGLGDLAALVFAAQAALAAVSAAMWWRRPGPVGA